jgi:hypothetical protein
MKSWMYLGLHIVCISTLTSPPYIGMLSSYKPLLLVIVVRRIHVGNVHSGADSIGRMDLYHY